MSEATTADAREKTVTDVAYQIEQATNNDGTVDVEITEVTYSSKSDDILVKFFTPLGKTKVNRFDRPQRNDSSFTAVQFAESYIGSFGAIEQMEGMTVKADPDSWELQTPNSTAVNVARKLGSVIDTIVPSLVAGTELLVSFTLVFSFIGFIVLPAVSLYSTVTTPVMSTSAMETMFMWLGSLFMTWISIVIGEQYFGWEP